MNPAVIFILFLPPLPALTPSPELQHENSRISDQKERNMQAPHRASTVITGSEQSEIAPRPISPDHLTPATDNYLLQLTPAGAMEPSS
jgi:hypothetical protein